MECLTVLETARKWDLSPPDGAAPLHRRSHSRRAEAREVLGHPRRRGKAPGRPTCPKAGGDRGRRCSGPHRPQAPDEHPLPAGNVRGRGTGHGGRPPAGHRLGGILLLHRPAGQSGAGGGGVCGGHLFRAAPPAAAQVSALRQGVPAPAAPAWGPLPCMSRPLSLPTVSAIQMMPLTGAASSSRATAARCTAM